MIAGWRPSAFGPCPSGLPIGHALQNPSTLPFRLLGVYRAFAIVRPAPAAALQQRASTPAPQAPQAPQAPLAAHPSPPASIILAAHGTPVVGRVTWYCIPFLISIALRVRYCIAYIACIDEDLDTCGTSSCSAVNPTEIPRSLKARPTPRQCCLGPELIITQQRKATSISMVGFKNLLINQQAPPRRLLQNPVGWYHGLIIASPSASTVLGRYLNVGFGLPCG